MPVKHLQRVFCVEITTVLNSFLLVFLFLYCYLYPVEVAYFSVAILFCENYKKKGNHLIGGKKQSCELLPPFEGFLQVR